MAIYADVIFFANFISTTALFLGVRAIFGIKSSLWRIIVSGAVAGCYGVAERYYLMPYPLRLALLIIICAIAFGYRGVLYNLLRVVATQTAIALLCTIILSLFGYNSLVMDASVLLLARPEAVGIVIGFLYPLLWLGTRLRHKYRQIITIYCNVLDTPIRLKLLYDSGNVLRYKGVGVVVINWMAVKPLLGVDTYDEVILKVCDRVIYSTVNNTGIMPVIYCRKALVRGVYKDIYIGLTEKCFRLYDGVMGDLD